MRNAGSRRKKEGKKRSASLEFMKAELTAAAACSGGIKESRRRVFCSFVFQASFLKQHGEEKPDRDTPGDPPTCGTRKF